MSSCCDEPSSKPTAEPAACPVCDAKGKSVESLTLKALLKEDALMRLGPGSYRFCAAPTCAVVYFEESGQTFSTGDVRVDVWQKLPFGRRTICYCFGENEAAMRVEVQRAGQSDAVARVRDHIAAGRCACEARSPAGVCCLGDVTRAVKQVVASTEADVAGR